MKPKIVFIHGNGSTHWNFAFSGWLKNELEKSGFATFFETFPDSIIARSEYWLPFLKDHVQAGENDVLVGWSSGAVASMRYAESNKIKGSVLISPCYTDLGDELEKQSGYYDKQWDWEAIKKNQEKITLIYGDDDPFIPQEQFEYIAEKLNPEVIKVPGGKHFIEYTEFPQLLKNIKDTYEQIKSA
jgi:predicted alpha/beta hydrolase family esterase